MPVPHVRRMRILRTLPVHPLPESESAFRFRLIVPSKSYSAINPISNNSSNPEIDEPFGPAEKNLLRIILFIPEFVGNGFQSRRSEDVQTPLRLRVHPVPNLKGFTAAGGVVGILGALVDAVLAQQGQGTLGGPLLSGSPFWVHAGSPIAGIGTVVAGVSVRPASGSAFAPCFLCDLFPQDTRRILSL